MLQTVAIQGYENSYHDILRNKIYKNSEMLGFGDFHSVTESVRSGRAQIGIIAVENSLAGTTPGFQELREFDGLQIIDENILDIKHRLLGVKGASINEVQSHLVAINQCRKNIKSLETVTRTVEVDDTATAASNVVKLVSAQGIKDVAAICSGKAASVAIEQCPELSVLDYEFNDTTPNETRFLSFVKSNGTSKPVPSDANKTTAMLYIPEVDGSLTKILNVLDGHKMGFSYIEASALRADSREGNVVVPLEISHSWNSEEFALARTEIEEKGGMIKNLGSYKAGDVISVD